MVGSGGKAGTRPTRADVLRICGELIDWKVQAIIASGASVEEIEVAAAWAEGADDVMGEARKPLAGNVAKVYDILTADRALDEEGGPLA